MTDPTSIEGRTLHGGHVVGPVLILDEALSMWGGLDPATGQIIDQQHPQTGENVQGKILAMPGSRGSSGTPGVLGEALRRGVGPIGLVLTKPDFNLIAGALVAETLYGTTCPIVLVTADALASMSTDQYVSLNDYDATESEQ